MCVLLGTWWMAGTVYLYFSPVGDSPGTRPLGGALEGFFGCGWRDLRRVGYRMDEDGWKRVEVENERRESDSTTHSPFSVGSISGNSRKTVL